MRPSALILGLVLAATPLAAKAEYPDHVVRIIVPVAAGGGVDVMARLLAQRLGERLGQQFIVENRPGAAGVIGSKFAASQPADGYTLLYTPSSLSLAVAVNKTPPYDVTRDFTPIIEVAISPYALVVNPSVPAKNFREFVAYAKANPGKLSFSSAGVGSASHLAAELLKDKTGISMVHVPNKGMHPAFLDLLGGQVQVMFTSVPMLQTDKGRGVRPLAMAELRRSALMPDLPTLDEDGLKGFQVGNWAGLLGPAGLDRAIVDKLHDQVVAILNTPDMQDRVKKLGFDLVMSTPAGFAAELRDDVDKWSGVAKRAGQITN